MSGVNLILFFVTIFSAVNWSCLVGRSCAKNALQKVFKENTIRKKGLENSNRRFTDSIRNDLEVKRLYAISLAQDRTK